MTEENRKRGARSRRRGANAEREIANIFRDKYGMDVRRGYVFQHESDIVGIDGIHPEVKRVEKLNVHKAMTQAIEETAKRKDGLPTVFHRRDRTEWLVTMRLDDWMQLYEAWRGTWEDHQRKD